MRLIVRSLAVTVQRSSPSLSLSKRSTFRRCLFRIGQLAALIAKSAKKKRFPQDDVALPIDAAPAAPAVDIDQTVDHWDEILHFDDDDDVLPEL